MCLANIKRKRQWFGKQTYAYKILRRTSQSNLQTPIVYKAVRNNCTDWQRAYQRVPRSVRLLFSYNNVHKGKISVFLTKKAAEHWSGHTDEEIWRVEIKYNEFLVGTQFTNNDAALVDEFRLVEKMSTGE